MTLTELRNNIVESNQPNWFNEVTSTFRYNYDGTIITLTGLSSLYEYVLKQIEGWEKFGETIPKELITSKTYFLGLKNQIVQFINRHKLGDLNQLNGHWSTINNNITNKDKNIFSYNSSEVSFLVKVFNEHPRSFIHSFQFIVNPNSVNISNKDSLVGSILAYEFITKDDSIILKRNNLERKSFATYKNDIETLKSEAEHELTEHLINIQKKFTAYSEDIDLNKSQTITEITNWLTTTKSNFEDFNLNSILKIKTLENAYEELLSLKKPAEYWKSRALELKKEGWYFSYLLMGLIVIIAFILYSLLWLTPEGMLKSFFGNDKTSAIRWTIIFITLISFLAFGIRALTKLVFSSFHLSRDAEERERLTYVYLAMIKDSSIEKEDRHLIMQSLFSRADTGLLREDSSPTMPGSTSIVERITN